MIILDLVHNLALLVALAVVCQVIESWWRMRRLTSRFLQGFAFGVVGVVGMMTPVHFMPGIIFDGRSIILSVGGAFWRASRGSHFCAHVRGLPTVVGRCRGCHGSECHL